MRQRWFDRQLELGRDPAGHRAGAPQPRRRAVGRRCPTTSSASPPACRRPSPRSSTTPTTRSAASSRASARSGELDNTILVLLADNGASQEGGPFGVMHEMKFFNGILETPDEAIERIDDIGGPHSHTNYPWGWAQCGNTPVQVVQAEHPRGRRARADDRALAGRHRRRPAGHEARPVRLRLRHRARPSTTCSASTPARDRNGLEQLPVTGHSFAAAPRRRRRAGHQHAAVLREGRQPRARRRRVEGRVQARPRRRLRHRAVGAVPPRGGSRRSATTSRPSNPSGWPS